MAIDFSGSANDKLNIGQAAAIAWKNNAVGTICFWVFPTVVSAQRNMLSLGTSGGSLSHTAAGRIEFIGGRATTNCNMLSTAGGVYGASKWCCIAAQWDTGASANCKLFHGDIATAMAEYAYTTQTAGSGAQNDDSAQNKLIATNVAGTQSYPGYVAHFALFSRLLTLAELKLWQRQPGALPNAVCYYHLLTTGAGDIVDRLGVGGATLTGGANQAHPALGGYLVGQTDFGPRLPQLIAGRQQQRVARKRFADIVLPGMYEPLNTAAGGGGGGGNPAPLSPSGARRAVQRARWGIAA